MYTVKRGGAPAEGRRAMRKKRMSFEKWAPTLTDEQRALAEELRKVYPQDLKGMFGREWIQDIFECFSFEEIEKELRHYNDLKRRLVPGAEVMNARRKKCMAPAAPLAVIISAASCGGYSVIDSNLDFDFWETMDCKPTGEFMDIMELKAQAEARRTEEQKSVS